MSLDTVPTPVAPHVLMNYVSKLDQRGEVYSFIANISDPRRSPPSLTLTLNRDGCDDAMTVVLRQDGTWSAEHVLVVGDKQ